MTWIVNNAIDNNGYFVASNSDYVADPTQLTNSWTVASTSGDELDHAVSCSPATTMEIVMEREAGKPHRVTVDASNPSFHQDSQPDYFDTSGPTMSTTINGVSVNVPSGNGPHETRILLESMMSSPVSNQTPTKHSTRDVHAKCTVPVSSDQDEATLALRVLEEAGRELAQMEQSGSEDEQRSTNATPEHNTTRRRRSSQQDTCGGNADQYDMTTSSGISDIHNPAATSKPSANTDTVILMTPANGASSSTRIAEPTQLTLQTPNMTVPREDRRYPAVFIFGLPAPSREVSMAFYSTVKPFNPTNSQMHEDYTAVQFAQPITKKTAKQLEMDMRHQLGQQISVRTKPRRKRNKELPNIHRGIKQLSSEAEAHISQEPILKASSGEADATTQGFPVFQVMDDGPFAYRCSAVLADTARLHAQPGEIIYAKEVGDIFIRATNGYYLPRCSLTKSGVTQRTRKQPTQDSNCCKNTNLDPRVAEKGVLKPGSGSADKLNELFRKTRTRKDSFEVALSSE